MRWVFAWLPVAVAWTAFGCDFEPDVGPAQVERCVNEDSDPDNAVSFVNDIVPLVMDKCLPCHDPNGSNNTGFQVGGLDLTSYETFTAGGVNGGAKIVIAGNPCDSVVIQKTSTAPPFGNRMPFDGPPFETAAEAQMVRDWIAEGASPE